MKTFILLGVAALALAACAPKPVPVATVPPPPAATNYCSGSNFPVNGTDQDKALWRSQCLPIPH